VTWQENAKRAAALSAVPQIKDGFVVGLGSGTTIAYALKEIGSRILERKLRVLGVPTSYQAFLLAVKHRIPLTTIDEHPRLDLALDGADQVDNQLDMIKGMGGALTREKIVASASKRNIIIIDETKLTNKLGANQPVPVEVMPFAAAVVKAKLRRLKGKPVLREAAGKLGPVVTDNGNFIFDVDFGPVLHPHELNILVKQIPGVIETGLFAGMADTVYVGGKTGVRTLRRH
jgi:ribose 5-phosphate isomerase A